MVSPNFYVTIACYPITIGSGICHVVVIGKGHIREKQTLRLKEKKMKITCRRRWALLALRPCLQAQVFAKVFLKQSSAEVPAWWQTLACSRSTIYKKACSLDPRDFTVLEDPDTFDIIFGHFSGQKHVLVDPRGGSRDSRKLNGSDAGTPRAKQGRAAVLVLAMVTWEWWYSLAKKYVQRAMHLWQRYLSRQVTIELKPWRHSRRVPPTAAALWREEKLLRGTARMAAHLHSWPCWAHRAWERDCARWWTLMVLDEDMASCVVYIRIYISQDRKIYIYIHIFLLHMSI